MKETEVLNQVIERLKQNSAYYIKTGNNMLKFIDNNLDYFKANNIDIRTLKLILKEIIMVGIRLSRIDIVISEGDTAPEGVKCVTWYDANIFDKSVYIVNNKIVLYDCINRQKYEEIYYDSVEELLSSHTDTELTKYYWENLYYQIRTCFSYNKTMQIMSCLEYC